MEDTWAKLEERRRIVAVRCRRLAEEQAGMGRADGSRAGHHLCLSPPLQHSLHTHACSPASHISSPPSHMSNTWQQLAAAVQSTQTPALAWSLFRAAGTPAAPLSPAPPPSSAAAAAAALSSLHTTSECPPWTLQWPECDHTSLRCTPHHIPTAPCLLYAAAPPSSALCSPYAIPFTLSPTPPLLTLLSPSPLPSLPPPLPCPSSL
ncbi:unnamed protein product [Closterium sp. Naga37s-1]|nr:unnamed protein product [Closterium sp. Naga37s-1]